MAEKADLNLVIDVSCFEDTMEKFIEFQGITVKSNRDLKSYMQFYADNKLIKSWGFPSDPHKVESFIMLPPKVWKQVDKAVSEAIGKIFQE